MTRPSIITSPASSRITARFAAHFASGALAMAASISLAACAEAEEKPTYEAGVEDVGGGELIVTEQTPGAVEVDLPETPMTPVPVDSATATPEPAAE